MPAGIKSKPLNPPIVAPEQEQALDKIIQQNQKEAAQAKKNAKPVRYYITTPLAKAKKDDPAKYGHVEVKITFQIHPGRTTHPITGEVVDRPASELTFYEGEAMTDDPLVAQYLKEQWPEMTVLSNSTRGKGLSQELQERQKLEELKAELDEEGFEELI